MSIGIVYAVLAAGSSRRMGFAKSLAPIGASSPLQRIGATLAGTPFVIVTNRAHAGACAKAVSGAAILINPEPLRGMTSSLRVADGAVDPAAHLGVLLADKPFVSEMTLRLCEAEVANADVVFPVDGDGVPGHPVIFSPRARARLRDLPDGDTLRELRDHPALTRKHVRCVDSGAFTDLDTIDDWRAAELHHGA